MPMMLPKMDSATAGKMKVALSELTNDVDKDVQYYAKKILST
jgi:hypothetical protein